MNGVDLSRFEFDYDTTWQAFFTDADLNVYSRYGGRDENSPDGRHSKESLLQTMREVLEIHERRRAQPSALAGDVHPLAPTGKKSTPEEIPLLRENHQGCVHCHQIQEYRLLQSFHDKTFRRSQLFGFPLPENIGLSFDGAHGHKIASVAPGSAAAKASLAPGDVVVGLDDVAIHSEQDVRWALHRAESGRPLAITVLRPARSDDDPPHSIRVELVPETGWKQTDLSWRKSLRSVPLPLGFLGYALGQEERRAADVPENRLAIRVVSLRGPGLAERLGLRKGDLIVSLDRNSARRTFEQFKSDLLRRHEPGDVVELSVLREEKSVELRGPFPDWHTTDTSVP